MDATAQEREERIARELHRWHIRRFTSLGFGYREAAMLELAHVDWHEADALLSRGCSHETALLILI